MNSSLYNLDRATHVKIVMVAAITATVVMIVGEAGQLDRSASAAPGAAADQRLMQRRPQPFWRAAPSRSPLMPAAKPETPTPKIA